MPPRQKKNVVIVESSAKEKIISKYLNKNDKLSKHGTFVVVATQGHIRDIRKKNGIDTETLTPIFENIESKKHKIAAIKDKIATADMTYLATDNDREGEGIAWHLRELFKLPDNKHKRIVFNEITKTALTHAVQHPIPLNMPVVNSYLSRRILDRLVGFMITKLLWKAFDSNVTLSAGRVQSATLKIIVDKEEEISRFTTDAYWTIQGIFGDILPNTVLYNCKDNRTWTILKLRQAGNVRDMLNSYLKGAIYEIVSATVLSGFDRKSLQEAAPPAFTTSTLQQTAYNKLGFSIKKTMTVAQSLYEMGVITYMRTDSTHINNDMIQNILGYVRTMYGDAYVVASTNKPSVKHQKHAQEAHEAIRPTELTTNLKKVLSNDQEHLYDLIFKRTIASCMQKAIYDEAKIRITCSTLKKESYMFVGTSKVLHFDGWLKVYGSVPSEVVGNALIKKFQSIKYLHPTEFKALCTWTTPPARYNESTIVHQLEKSGIGRPSTYVSILTKLFDKQYIKLSTINGVDKQYETFVLDFGSGKLKRNVEIKKVGSENKKIVPHIIGHKVNTFVSTSFPHIVDAHFTSSMEDSLDQIAQAQQNHQTFLKNFFGSFDDTYNKVLQSLNTNKHQIGKDELLITDKSVEAIINDKNKACILRHTRYGPVIELRSKRSNEKSSYINLKMYLQDTGKQINELHNDDLRLLLSIPINIHLHNIKIRILYGRYGFYIKKIEDEHNVCDRDTYRIYKQYIPLLLTNDYNNLLRKLKIIAS
jgi:DNA topoisomerase-1